MSHKTYTYLLRDEQFLFVSDQGSMSLGDLCSFVGFLPHVLLGLLEVPQVDKLMCGLQTHKFEEK